MRVHFRSSRLVESLEPRTLLSATIVQPVPNATLHQDVSQSIDLSTYFDDPTFTGTLTQLSTSLGTITLELDDTVAPQTVSNFLQYVNAGLYNNTIIHRVVNDDPPNEFRIMQGGGFDPTGAAIPTPFGPVPNEFHTSNTRGTIAMARVQGQPDSATDQWFINDSDNTALDTVDGGFTVFGHVVSGMDIVDQITQLPTVDGTALNTQFGSDLPVLNPIADGAVPQPTDLVQVTAAVLPKLTLQAVSENTALVAASVVGTTLTLTPVAGQSGITFVSVTALDLSGVKVADTFRVVVTPDSTRALDVTLGKGRPFVTFQEPDGSFGTVTLGGPGSAVVHFGGDGLKLGAENVIGSHVQVMGIDATGTTAASSLTIRGHGGKDDAILIGGITTNGAFGGVKIIRTLIQGDLTIAGGVNNFRCDFARGGTINLGPPIALNRRIKVLGLSWFDENLVTSAVIAKFHTNNWFTTDSLSESFQAPAVRKLISRGNFTPGLQLTGVQGIRSLGYRVFVAGSIGGTWDVPGGIGSLSVGSVASDFNGAFPVPFRSFSVAGDFLGSLSAPSIGSLTIKGAMTGAAISVTQGDLKSLSVRNGINGSVINVAGSIGSISAKFLNNSDVFAGITAASGQTGLPASAAEVAADNFAAESSIGKVTLTAGAGATFLNSNLVASALGVLNLGRTATINSGTPFGVAARSIKLFVAADKSKSQTLRFVNVHDPATVATQVAAQSLVLNDLTINVFLSVT